MEKLYYFECELEEILQKIKSKNYTAEDIQTVNKCLNDYVEGCRRV